MYTAKWAIEEDVSDLGFVGGAAGRTLGASSVNFALFPKQQL